MAKTIIVVGAGMGGLVAAAELAHAGHKVTLFEQHAHVGGKMHHAMVDGAALDTGPTVMTLRHVFDALFEKLGANLDDFVTLRPLDILARHLWQDNAPFNLYADTERNEAAIAQTFGGDAADGYRAFARYTEALYRLACAPFIYAARPSWTTPAKVYGMGALTALWRIDAHRSMMRALRQFFPKHPHLRQLFGRYATYVGASPWRAPATLNLIAHVEGLGVWSVQGGMHMLAEAVAKLATLQGARIELNQPVVNMVSRNGAIAGVVLADGRLCEADAVVFNGDVRALSRGHVPVVPYAQARRPAPKREETRSGHNVASGLSAVTWGARRSIASGSLAAHTVLFAPAGGKSEFDALFEGAPPCVSPTVYVCAPQRGQMPSAPDGKALPSTCGEPLFCLVNAKPTQDRWTQDARDEASAKLMQRFSACGISFDTPMTASDILHTPSCHAQRFLGSDGALYGESPHSMAALFRRPSSIGPVRGLYLAGGGVHPGAGVPMAAQSGRLAAAAIGA